LYWQQKVAYELVAIEGATAVPGLCPQSMVNRGSTGWNPCELLYVRLIYPVNQLLHTHDGDWSLAAHR
jgi:hypothetical protein